jgi:hypothetical protein
LTWVTKGGREKQNDESDVHLPRHQKKSSYLLHFFYQFVYRVFLGVLCQGEFKNAKTKVSKKNPSGLITKNAAFFPPFFFFILPRLFGSIFLSRFWAFRNKGSSKTRLKKSREFFRSRQKKYLLLT